MTALLWILLILGLIEVGGCIGYLVNNQWPPRTKAGIVINLLLWAALSVWIVALIAGGAP